MITDMPAGASISIACGYRARSLRWCWEEEGQIDLYLDDDDKDEEIAKSTGGVTRLEDAGS
jgi:hypothetical protein